VAGNPTLIGGTSAAGGSNSIVTSGTTATTTQPVPKLSITSGKSTVRVAPILGATLDVTLAREGSVTGDVKITVDGLPNGVVAPNVLVPAESTSAKLTFTSDSTAPIGGPYKVVVTASNADSAVQAASVSVNLYVAQSPGSFDTSFGDKGIVRFSAALPGSSSNTPVEMAWRVAVDDTSRVYVGGGSSSTDGSSRVAWVLRLSGNGTLDQGFAASGINRDLGTSPTSLNTLLTVGDKLFVSATYTDSITSSPNYFLRRYTTAGNVDSGFNGGHDIPLSGQPFALVRFGSDMLSLAYLKLQLLSPDGEIRGAFTPPTSIGDIRNIAADPQNRILYSLRPLGSDEGFSVGRLLSNGTIDTTFGSAGLTKVSCPMDPKRSVPGTLWSIGVTADSKVLTVANCGADLRDSYEWEGAIQAFTSAGVPDMTFGDSGKLLLASPGAGRDMILQEDGRILVVVVDHAPDPDVWSLRRIEASSTTDFSFAQRGNLDMSKAASSIFSYAHMAYDTAAQRVVVIGNDSSGGFLVTRIWL
jgi:uncharacterized delta-60 repeat protein